MKLINIIILTFGFISIGDINAQDRNVFWNHGLGDNATTWNFMENIFDTEYQMSLGDNSPTYDDMNGLATATTSTITNIDNEFGAQSTNANNIGIGHSLGGVVLRNVDATQTGNNSRFGGIITVGSPNDGAMISNNVANGNVADAMEHACGELLAGPSSAIPFVGIIIQAIIPEIICDILRDELIEPLITDQVNNPTAVNLRVGSAAMNAINNSNSTIPQISLWGNENSPVHWRILSSVSSGNANDTDFVIIASQFRSVYNSFYTANLTATIVSGIFGFFNPFSWAATAAFAFKAIQWKRGVNWFDNSEAIWNVLIGCGNGASQQVTTTVVTQDVNCNCFGYTGSPEWINCIMTYCGGDINNCYIETEVTTNVFANGRSDGFICMDSQLIDGTSTTDHYRADGANHIQETNHNNVRVQIDRIVNGDRGTDDFFTTDPR